MFNCDGGGVIQSLDKPLIAKLLSLIAAMLSVSQVSSPKKCKIIIKKPEKPCVAI